MSRQVRASAAGREADGIGDAYEYLIDNQAACIGTPDDAIAYITQLLEGAGGFGSILELAHNWADFPDTLRHFELMARYVLPHFQHSREWREESYGFARSNGEAFRSQSQAAVQTEIDRRRTGA